MNKGLKKVIFHSSNAFYMDRVQRRLQVYLMNTNLKHTFHIYSGRETFCANSHM